MELILASYAADLIFGDPQWFPHPVRIIGKQISFFDRRLNLNAHKNIQRLYGVFVTASVVGISGICAYAVIELAGMICPLAGKIAWVFFAYTTVAIKDLFTHARAVRNALAAKDLGDARKKLSLIVGRDTEKLPEGGIIRATAETVAESAADGVIAPLIYLFLGGPSLAVMFKAISTLDSMIGHKNERYLYFGWCAAKLDDIANYIPARVTGVLISLAALITGKNAVEALRVMIRDGRKQDSPNSAVSEAAMAGALGVRMGGACSYAGRVVDHPYLGEQKKAISLRLIDEALLIAVTASALMISIGIIVCRMVFGPSHL